MSIQCTTKWLIGVVFLNLLISPTAMGFEASVKSTYSYDNNVFKTEENRSSDNIMIVSPSISTRLPYKNYAFGAAYFVNYGRHSEQSTEDYINQNFRLNLLSNAKAKYSGLISYAYQSRFDVRGELGSESIDVPDLWASNSVDSSLMYRTDDNRASYKLNLGVSEKRYSVEKSKIKDSNSFLLRFINNYKLTGKSKVHYSISRDSVKYPALGIARFDSLSMAYLVGFSWVYSGKIDATADVGWKTKRVIESGDQVFSGVIAKINLLWALKSYSRYSLSLGRDAKTSPEVGATNSVVNSISLDWTHTFTRKLTTKIGLSVGLNQANTGQTNTLTTISTSVQYVVTRWFDIAPNIQWKTFKSTASEQEYDNYIASVQFRLKYSR